MTTSLPPPLRGARILVVEDDFLVRLEIETVLRDAGAGVLACGTVAEALASIDAQEFDAAVLDVRLLGGETVAPVASKLAEIDTPFLFYTGTADTATAQWPQARVIAKPAAPAVLIDAVVETMSRRVRR